MDAGETLLPYGMQRMPDGAWLFFNRQYKPAGVVDQGAWEAWDDPRHKLVLKGLGPATLAKLDCSGRGGAGDRIYFYDDASSPALSEANMKAYLAKLRIVMGLRVVITPGRRT